MSEIERDSLVDKVNQQLTELERRASFRPPSGDELKKMQMLEILIRRYIGGERTERLFEIMKSETGK